MCGCREREAEKDVDLSTGRWSGLPREERTCPVCSVPVIEDVQHFILKCELGKEEWKDLFSLLQRLGVEVEQQEDIQKTASILQVAAKEEGVARMIKNMPCMFGSSD